MEDARTRLNHPHYLACALLCVPFPASLASSLVSTTKSASLASSSLSTTLFAAPLVLALSVVAWRPPDNIETFCERTTFQLRLLNLFGFVFTRNQLGTGWRAVLLYFAAWMAVSFFLPQPPYLGPSKLRPLSSEDFEKEVLLLPPAPSVSLGASSDSHPKIVELPDDATDTQFDEPVSPEIRERYHLVLFHADFSKKSRELELTLSRLSNRYTSPRLSFVLLDPDAAPTTFYDLGLATGPTSLDLPLLRLYRRGKPVQQLPLTEREASRLVRRKKRADRRREKQTDGIADSTSESGSGSGSGEEEEGEGDSGVESDDEREVEQERAMSRYRWDTSAAAIERTFKLRERSGIDPAALQ